MNTVWHKNLMVENFDASELKKFWCQVKNWQIPICLFCHHHDHHAYCMHATLLSYIASYYSYVSRNLIANIHMYLHVHGKHKSATPFLGSHRKCVSMMNSMWYYIAVHALNSFQVYQYAETFTFTTSSAPVAITYNIMKKDGIHQ